MRWRPVVEAGSEGVVFLPFLAGAGQPENDPDARGVFYGLTLKHGKGHCARAIMESIAFMLRKILADFVRSGVEMKEVRSMGGGARSDLWLQIKADVIGLPIARMEEEETVDPRGRHPGGGAPRRAPRHRFTPRRPW